MRSLFRTLLLPALTLLFPHTLASPPLHQENAPPPTNDINPAITCYTGSRQASTQHCIHAAQRYPQTPNIRTFHFNGADDGYQLPQGEYVESCMVLVTLHDTSVARNSWENVVQVANQVAVVCAVGSNPRGMTGGYALMGGEEGHVEVFVERYRRVGAGGGNGTIGGAVARRRGGSGVF